MPVNLVLTNAEAVVLFDLLSRYSDSGELAIADQAEQRVLWNLGADLEKQLAEPFQADYPAILERARAAVRDEPG